MKSKIKVIFDMSFDSSNGECKTLVGFQFLDHPAIECPDHLKRLLIGEIKILVGAADAAGEQLFTT